MAKRIILLLDGTWNDADRGPYDTNIVRMRDLIARHLQRVGRPLGNSERAPETGKLAHGYVASDMETYVFYERGVGTGAFDRISGGALGEGLSRNIRRAYKFLSYWYEPGDQVFIYGFSRGAYTARSLVGYLASAGLLKRDACTPENEATAWHYYRTAPNDRMPGIWSSLTPLVNDRSELKIALIGVFDTVGALGIPLKVAWRANREKYEFHDVELSSITAHNLHAIAIDEHRFPFEAALWRKPKFKTFESKTEQVWFAGAHADVGGSYIDETRRKELAPFALDDITLSWMLKRTVHYFPDFPCDLIDWSEVGPNWAYGGAHNPRRGLYKLLRFAIRAISNTSPTIAPWRYQAAVSHDRHSEVINEMVHISALERLGRKVDTDRNSTDYRPENLLSVLPAIRRTYGLTENEPKFTDEIKVVDWKGNPIAADAKGSNIVAALLQDPKG